MPSTIIRSTHDLIMAPYVGSYDNHQDMFESFSGTLWRVLKRLQPRASSEQFGLSQIQRVSAHNLRGDAAKKEEKKQHASG